MITGSFVIFVLLLHIFKCILVAESGDPLQEQYGLLKHASVLHRHGDRGPVGTFPLDPFKDYPWQDGFGQLINGRGLKVSEFQKLDDQIPRQKRLAEVGKWFRTRYENFINETYSRKEVRIHSSSMDRCIMSTQCFLYGLYPAVGEQIWLPNEKWHPIPVYAIPKKDDNKLRQSRECKLRDILQSEEEKDPKYEVTYDEYEKAINVMVNATGIDVANKTKAQIIKALEDISGILIVYEQNNFTLPDWIKNFYPEPLNTILSKTTWKSHFDLTIARIDAGPFLHSVVEDMNRKITDQKYEKKLHVHSAHDSTIRNVMIGLKTYEDINPAYGSTLIFELREKNSTNYVTVSYRNDTSSSDARLLDVPGCGLTCTFEQFYKVTEPLIPEDWDNECKKVMEHRLL